MRVKKSANMERRTKFRHRPFAWRGKGKQRFKAAKKESRSALFFVYGKPQAV